MENLQNKATLKKKHKQLIIKKSLEIPFLQMKSLSFHQFPMSCCRIVYVFLQVVSCFKSVVRVMETLSKMCLLSLHFGSTLKRKNVSS